MPVLAHIKAQARNRIGRFVRNAVPLQDFGVHPDAVSLRFLNLNLAIGTDCIEILFCNVIVMQILFVKYKPIARKAGIFLHKVHHIVQRFLFAIGC